MPTSKEFGRTLGALEHQIMAIFWQATSPITVGEVIAKLREKRRLAYTTVFTITNRLVDKKLLKRNQDSWPYSYEPCCSANQFYSAMAGNVLNRIKNDFGDLAVAYFLEETERIDRKNLKKLIRKLRKEP